jgi:hypothetical protein
MKRNLVRSVIYTLTPALFGIQTAHAYVYAHDEDRYIKYEEKIAQIETEETSFVKVPTFDSGFMGAIGILYLAPSADNQVFGVNHGDDENDVTEVLNFDPGYDVGFDISLGYVFADTANAIELDYRELSTSDTDSGTVRIFDTDFDATGDLSYDLNALDLMLSQFVDVGRFIQMRLEAGLSYAEIKQTIKTNGTDNDAHQLNNESKFSGWGPRVGIDGRYGFGLGMGIVGGTSLAYYLGSLDVSASDPNSSQKDDRPSHTVANLRANLGIDYIFYMKHEDSTSVGLELGYLVDYYNDAVGSIQIDENVSDTFAASFSGPYLNLKGVF